MNPFITLIARPAIAPGLAAAAGLMYGSYDVALRATRLVLGVGSTSDVPVGVRAVSFTGGAAAGFAAAYARTLLQPAPPPPSLELVSQDRVGGGVLRSLQQRVHALRHFPVRYWGFTLVGAGMVAGVVAGAMQRSMVSRRRGK
mmetsp:Transcript_11518/g.38929  ORF Transcript_11518/g.38929 Transcript_11518/m.38929 type:complete len:143 (+) Transcript_11518:50-478(+)